jgi:hypothetical protein
VIGARGMLSLDSYRQYRCPVYLEIFDAVGLNARKFMSVRRSSFLRTLFGVGGRPLPLLGRARQEISIAALKRQEINDQDKVLGVAELAEAIAQDRPAFPPPDFTLHLAELTFAIQAAGLAGAPTRLTTKFTPLEPRAEARTAPLLRPDLPPPWRRWLGKRLEALHRH